MFDVLEGRRRGLPLTCRNAIFMMAYTCLFGMLIGMAIARHNWDASTVGMLLLQAIIVSASLGSMYKDLKLLLKK